MLIIIVLAFLNIFSRGYDQTINAKLYGGWGFVSPTDMNAKLTDATNGFTSYDSSNAIFSEGINEASRATNFGFELGYQFKYRFNIALLFDYTSVSSLSSASSETPFNVNIENVASTANYYEFNQGASAYSIGLLGSYSIYSNKRIVVDLSAGLLYAFSMNYFEDVYSQLGESNSGVSNDASSSGLGFLFGGTFNYSLMRNLSFGLNANYRILNFASLADSEGYEYPFTYPNGVEDTSAPMSVDLSGMYFTVFLRYDFALNSSSNYDEYGEPNKQSSDYSFDEKKYKEDLKNEKIEVFNRDSELSELKDRARKKYKDAVNKKDIKAQNTYNKLYDIIDKLEKGTWEKLSKEEKSDKLDKINKILK